MLTATEMMALGKAIKAKDIKCAREQMSPGEHPVDVTVRVSGYVNVAKDTEKTPTSALLNQEFLMLVLHKAGFMREQAMDLLRDTAEEYLDGWVGSDEDRANAKDMRKELVEKCDPEGKISAFLKDTKISLPKTKVLGAVKFDGVVEVVEDAVAAVELGQVG